MKRLIKKSQKLVKGMPTAVIVAIAFHAALFFLAGLLVVFTVVKKKEPVFEQVQAVERPKMKLRKPKPMTKKSPKPKASRIMTKKTLASMPEIQLPELGGMGGEGLGGGLGGFDMMPGLSDTSVFGSGQSIGNDLVGTFYDLKRDRQGRDLPVGTESYLEDVLNFIESGWKTSTFAKFYRSPNQLFATHLMIPPIRSIAAPAAFGEPDTGGYCWAVHYKGQLVHQDGITFRFWGHADDLMLVRVDGKLVLVGNDYNGKSARYFLHLWSSSSAASHQYFMGDNKAEVGDWITLEPGVPLNMDILIGENPGGVFCAMLAIEVEGVEYERGPQGNPILPMFRTTELSHTALDNIYKDLTPGEVCLTNGPIFSDYDTTGWKDAEEPIDVKLPQPDIPADDEPRMWTRLDGKTLEASFLTKISDKVVLLDSDGHNRKIPFNQFSEEDRMFIELALPPTVKIDFAKQSKQFIGEKSPFSSRLPPRALDYIFTAKIKQTSAGSYNHELHAECFVIGAENVGERYVLLDYQKSSFTLTRDNGTSHTFSGEPVRLTTYDLFGDFKGLKYARFLIVITDSRGKIIAHETPSKWLFENLEALRRLPVGSYMDKTCTRRFPSVPTSNIY